MFCAILLSSSLSLIKLNQEINTLNQDYERITYQRAKGKFINQKYLSSHTMTSNTDFTVTSTGDKDGYPLANVFDASDNYWVSEYPNNATFHSYIDINFKTHTSLESFLITGKILDYDNNGNNDYHGFPTKIKVYTALNDDELLLNTVFVGSPVHPMTEAQFVFSNPVNCTKVRLEFSEVTEDKAYSNGEHTTVIKSLKLIKSLGFDDVEFKKPESPYDQEYTKLHTVPRSQYTFTSTGDKDQYPISNAFDSNLGTCWISNQANSDTFHSSIFINFTDPLLLEGFSLGAKHSDTSFQRTYHGFPTQLNFYIADEEGSFKLHSKFTGSLDVYDEIDYFQFILLEPVQCSRIQLEFYEVTTEPTSGNTKTAAISDVFLLKNIDNETIKIEEAKGNYADDDIIKHRSISIKSYSSTGDKEGFGIENAFDNNASSYWISQYENNDTFHGCIWVEFESSVLLEAFIYDSYIRMIAGKKYIIGFPLKLNFYTALNNDDYTLNSVFVGTPESTMNKIQFVLSEPVNCTKVKLEFVEIKQYKEVQGVETAACANLNFIKKMSYQYLKFHKNTGFDDSHQLKTSQFNYNSSGDQDEAHDISKAFDGQSTTAWFSKDPNSDTFSNYIDINFNEPVLLESFLISPYVYETDNNIKNYYICGFPLELDVYTSLNEEELKLSAMFSGTLDQRNDHSDTFLFELETPISCSKLRLKFNKILTCYYLNLNAKTAAIADILIIAKVFTFSDDKLDDDLSTYYIDDQYPPDSIHEINFTSFTLPKGDEYLFDVKKQFNFNAVTISPKMNIGAIKCTQSNHVSIVNCLFDSCSVRNENGNGGAIYARNTGLNCKKSDFKKCSSNKRGNGGGLFIVNNEKLDKEVIIEGCNFNECSAIFGGAIYIYSNIDTNLVTISKCIFTSNSLIESDKSNGGSAIYAKIKAGNVVYCKFRKNSGSGSVVYDNNFDEIEKANFLTEKSSFVSIKECLFEIDSSASSSVLYMTGKNNNKYLLNVDNCVFIGKLKNGAHHITINSSSDKDEKIKFNIKSCKFASDQKNSINLNSKSFVNLDLKNQVFDYVNSDDTESKKSKFNDKFGLSVQAFSIMMMVFVIIAIISAIIYKNYNQNIEETNSINEIDI